MSDEAPETEHEFKEIEEQHTEVENLDRPQEEFIQEESRPSKPIHPADEEE